MRITIISITQNELNSTNKHPTCNTADNNSIQTDSLVTCQTAFTYFSKSPSGLATTAAMSMLMQLFEN